MHAIRQATLVATVALFSFTATATARADEFSDFGIPEHHVLLWTGDANAHVNWSHSAQAPQHDNRGNEDARLGTSFFSWHESEAGTRSLQGRLQLDGSRQHLDRLQDTDWVRARSQDASSALRSSATASWNETRYGGRGPLALVLGANGSLEGGRNWSGSHSATSGVPPFDSLDRRSDSSTQRVMGTALEGSVGLGIGRVRDATGLFVARTIEDRLRAAGVLTRPLGAAARRELAAIVFARNDYGRAYDRPAEAIWTAMGDVFRRDGALARDDWDGGRLVAAVQPLFGPSSSWPDGTLLPVSPILRRVGWAARLELVGSTSHGITRTNWTETYVPGHTTDPNTYRNTGASRWSTSNDGASASVSGEWHRAAGERAQWDASSSLQMPVHHEGHGLDESAQAAFTWLLTDRWQAEWDANQNRSYRTHSDWGGSWAAGVSATVRYWLNDRMSANASLSQGWSGQHDSSSSPIRTYDGGRVDFGLSYRFRGGTDTPVPAVR